MAIRKITADFVFPISRPCLPNGVVVFDDQSGEILDIQPQTHSYDPRELETYKGAIIPGFINTHCHLELSHLLGKIATGTGLIHFIGQVVQNRNHSQEIIQAAIQKADLDMQNEGIVAVGDISNAIDTFAVKSKSPIRYYTFVECFDFFQTDKAQQNFDAYKKVYDALTPPPHQAKSLVPHANYSVSPTLFGLINAEQPQEVRTVSIHNQEMQPENELFLTHSGELVDWVAKFGFSYKDLTFVGKTAIHYALQQLDHRHRTLFVHNTLTTAEDIRAAVQANPNTFWATCANANLYIENRLPNYAHFIQENAALTIGTDSLTSNWQLSVLDELRTIQKYQSYVPFETLLQWATLNGARALGFDDTLGSIDIGKKPALLLLNINPDFKLRADTFVQRII